MTFSFVRARRTLTERISPQSGAMIERYASEQQRMSRHEARTNATWSSNERVEK